VRVSFDSTNGTWVNKEKMNKGEERELQNGDKIVLVQAGKDQVAFIYLEPDVAPRAARSDGLVASPTGLADFRSGDESGPAGAGEQEDGPSTSPGPPAKKAKLSGSPEKAMDLQEHLNCPICQEILHQPACALPCLHSFCGGCISPWLKVASR